MRISALTIGLCGCLVGLPPLAHSAETLGLVVARTGDPVFAMMACGAHKAAKEIGAHLTVDGPAQWDATEQIPVLRAMIARAPDGLVIDPTDSQALQAPLKEALSAGIKTVTVDSELGGDLGIPHIGTDGTEGGREAARQLAHLIHGKGTVLVVGVAPGIAITDERNAGFDEVMKTYPGITLLPKQYAGDSPDKVASAIRAALSAHPDLAGIHADATLIGEFVGSTLRNLRRKDIPVVTFDASPTEVEWLKQGYLDVLMPFNPYDLGYRGVMNVSSQLQGKKVEKLVTTGYTVVTRDNLTQPNVQATLYTFSCK
jgi:ribose transport system substrate-binding protein